MNPIITATRYHDFCAGHRVTGHESKCAHLHGHNYRVYFECAAPMDEVGRVVDFSEIKTRLCDYVEAVLDHKFLIWREDPLSGKLRELDPDGVKVVDFNPTAENIALWLLNVAGPAELRGSGVVLVSVELWETRKCLVKASR